MHIRSIVSPLLKWFGGNARDLPWRRTRDPYAIWISEIMLQQTQVKTVIPYWQRWMVQLPNVASLAAANEDTVIKLWEGLGYYSRARNLQRAAKRICDELGGRFPRDLAGVLALPGVGRYTGGAICSIAYNQPKPIVDGNVARVLTRLLGIEESPRDKPVTDYLWSVADELVEHAVTLQKPRQRNASAFNQAIMELGALVCTPRNPLCDDCLLKGRCTARKENKVETIPALAKRAAATKRRGERRFLGVSELASYRFVSRPDHVGQVTARSCSSATGEAMRHQPLHHPLPQPTRDLCNRARPQAALGQTQR